MPVAVLIGPKRIARVKGLLTHYFFKCPVDEVMGVWLGALELEFLFLEVDRAVHVYGNPETVF